MSIMPRNIRAFHQSFLDQVRSNGRLFETGFVMQYKLRSGAVFQDAGNAPAMLRRGKLGLRADRIRGSEEMRRIFRLCEEAEDAAQTAPARGDDPAAGAGGADR